MFVRAYLRASTKEQDARRAKEAGALPRSAGLKSPPTTLRTRAEHR
jgi:DNA invertase Pin-like site-specific DNA recombinase